MSGGFKVADAYVEVSAKTDKAEGEVEKFTGSSLKSKLGAGAAAAGVAAGGLLAAGFAQNMNIAEANAKLAGQLGLTSADAKKAGEVAGAAYADNWGGSIEEVNAALKAVGGNMADLKTTSKADLQSMTESALALASTFDVDVNDSTRAAGQLMKTGLAKDSKEAFDIITAGFQGGLDSSGDWLDTLNEYGTQFRSLGLSGADATKLISQSMKAGARDSDIAADAIKEFSLRTQGSLEQTDSKGRVHLTALGSAFESVGLSGKAMTQAQDDLAKGGEPARAAFQKMTDGLRAIKDPAEQGRTATALFGTQAEDLKKALFAMDLSKPAQGMGEIAGAADKMASTVGDTAGGKIETFKRKLEGIAQSAASSTGPMGLVSTAALTFGGGALAAGAQVGTMVTALGALNGALIMEKINLVGSTVAKYAGIVASGIATGATTVWTGAQWLLNAALTANPIGIVIVVIVALVAAIIIAYKNSETFRNIVQAAMKGVMAAFQWVWDKAKAFFGWLQSGWSAVKGFITGPVSDANKVILTKVTDIFNWFKALPEKIKSAFGNANQILVDIGKRLIQGLIDGVSNMLGSLKSKFTSVTNMIPSWKGPPSKDATLLRPAGRSIIGGLQSGVDDAMPSLKAQLGGITATIGATSVGQAGAGGGASIQNLNVTVSGSFDMSSAAERKAAANALVRDMQEALVAWEGGRR